MSGCDPMHESVHESCAPLFASAAAMCVRVRTRSQPLGAQLERGTYGSYFAYPPPLTML